MAGLYRMKFAVFGTLLGLIFGCADSTQPVAEQSAHSNEDPDTSTKVLTSRPTPKERVKSDRYSMTIIKPDPNRNYTVRRIKPDPNVDYKMQVYSPEAGTKKGRLAKQKPLTTQPANPQ
jgi:hypothetical protein